MPSIVIISQLCPDKVEATMYALFAGSSNLGSDLANYGGAFVMDYLGVEPSGALNESRQFDNLWVASLISAVAPCIPLLLLTILVPVQPMQLVLFACGRQPRACAAAAWPTN